MLGINEKRSRQVRNVQFKNERVAVAEMPAKNKQQLELFAKNSGGLDCSTKTFFVEVLKAIMLVSCS